VEINLKKIRFLNRGEIYRKALESIWMPVAKHLPSDSYIVEESVYDYDKRTWMNQTNKKYYDITFFSDVSFKHNMFICHGNADKNYRYTKKMNLFDIICVSGELWKEKLINQGISPNKIKVVGHPKLDILFNTNKVIHNDGKIHVLYAPTHNVKPDNPNSTSSYPRFENDLKFLERNKDFDIKASYHPVNNNSEITFDLLLWADVVISDSSSMLYESWALGIPVVFPDYLMKKNILSIFPNSFESQIYSEGIGYHAGSRAEVKNMIYSAFEDGIDYHTMKFIEGIFAKDTNGKSGQMIAKIVLEGL
jgi:hypothetical protein